MRAPVRARTCCLGKTNGNERADAASVIATCPCAAREETIRPVEETWTDLLASCLTTETVLLQQAIEMPARDSRELRGQRNVTARAFEHFLQVLALPLFEELVLCLFERRERTRDDESRPLGLGFDA